ncbi:hypothetical protein CERSUDRAFT_114747 [Gelatoporia subvermispora B]|uniref:BTB domain-containing protein n=1 Tax=Ceriporiopsis subvermispora (strain B) TaxID=914234 RepID=M2REE5_CERS8|nr:hypothetical protein CERSUDRAFT_114747 [Gelatoporia subvermispora B]
MSSRLSDDTAVKLTKSTRFYSDEPDTVIFNVESTLFRVNPYLLKRDSEVFRSMFSCPPGVGGAEGAADERPINIPEVAAFEFECLLEFLYEGMYTPRTDSVPYWKALLSISSRFVFDRIRQAAVKSLGKRSPPLHPTDLIFLANKYSISPWLKPAYTELCMRKEPLSDAEATTIGVKATAQIARAREAYRLNTLDSNVIFSCGHELPQIRCAKCAPQNATTNFVYRSEAQHAQIAEAVVKMFFFPYDIL